MPRDQIKMNTKNYLKDKKDKKNKKADDRRRKQIESDSSDNDSIDSELHSSSEEDDEIDQHEYRKFLAKMFPSKHINKKVKAGDKLKKAFKKSVPLSPIKD